MQLCSAGISPSKKTIKGAFNEISKNNYNKTMHISQTNDPWCMDIN